MIDREKKANLKLSIIVPVYNTEPYLNQCIDSLQNQTFKDIEIILVDDGSTDACGMICDEYSQKDSRIEVLHQRNKGRVCARKSGLEYASGKYVLFIDSDDWVDSNMCWEMLHLAQNYHTDLVTSGFFREKKGAFDKETDVLPEGLYASEDELKELILESMLFKGMDQLGILSPVWAKLYRRDIAMKVMTLIPESMKRGEDFTFNNLYLLNCKSVYISKGIYYHYRFYEGSTVTSPCPDFIHQIGMSHYILQKAFIDRNNKELLTRLNTRILLHFVRMWNIENGLDSHIPYYYFDYEELGKGKIILYGAGKVGVDYHMQFVKTMPHKLVLWVDKNHQKNNYGNYVVAPVDNIKTVKYDKIFIAVESEKMALEIKEELMDKFQINENEIVWQAPRYCWI